MKRLLAIILTITMIMSMAISVSAAEINSVNVSNPQKTTDNKNIAFTLPTAMESGETAVVHIMGTTDTDFRVWLGSLNNSASNIAYMIKDGNNFDFAAELTTTGSATTVTLKTLNSWDSSATANSLSTLAGVTVTTLEVFYGTMDEYNAFLTTPTNTTPHIAGVDFSFDPEITMLYTYVDVPEDITFDNYFMLKWYSGNELLTRSIRNLNRTQAFSAATYGVPTLIYGNYNDEAVDGWCYDSWTADVHKCPTKVELWINGSLVDTYNFDDHAEEYGVVTVRAAWNSTYITGDAFEGNMPAEVDAGNANVSTGYFATGDETHAMIIGGAIITSNHVYNANGDCVYCGYHKDVVEDEVVIETPVESDTEEVDEDSTDDVEVDDKTTDTNPTTGVALAIVPMAMAAVAVVASKRR